MTEQFARKMEEGVKPLGIRLSEKQLEQFYDYFQFLVEKNKVMNLTAITDVYKRQGYKWFSGSCP